MDSTTRFSDRVENYVKYRPSYPDAMVQFLFERGIGRDSTVCDIGAGTGILSKLLIRDVGKMYALEPNESMRSYAEESLSHYVNYQSLKSTAEDTRLGDSSIDAITVAQAFHWFDREKCKTEFTRILKDNGLIFLIWNNRISNTPFLQAYDDLLHQYGTDYAAVNHQNLSDVVLSEFIDKDYAKTVFDNSQVFDLEGFLGRAFSSSYTPGNDSPDYQPFAKELRLLFQKHERGGAVIFNYKTEVYSGRMEK